MVLVEHDLELAAAIGERAIRTAVGGWFVETWDRFVAVFLGGSLDDDIRGRAH